MNTRSFLHIPLLKEDRVLSIATLLLLTAYVTFLPWHASLWVDETLTAWITSGSLSDTFTRALTFQGQSPLYFLLEWCVRQLLGSSENALRLLSVTFGVFSISLVYVIGRRWFGTFAAIASVLLLIMNAEFSVAVISARPYTMALFFSLLSIYSFDRGLTAASLEEDAGTRPWISLSAFALVLSYYAHYLFLFSGIVSVMLLMIRYREVRCRSNFLRVTLTVASIGAFLLVPGLLQLQSLSARSAQLSFATKPSLAKLLLTLIPPYLWIVTFIGSVIVIAYPPPRMIASSSNCIRHYLPILPLWWALPPLFFSVYSHIAPHSIFVPRLFLWCVPAMAFSVAALTSLFRPKIAKTLLLVIALFSAQAVFDRRWQVEPWREAAELVRQETGVSPVLLYTGLIESEHAEWLKDRSFRDYLTAPFLHYAVPQEVLPVSSTSLLESIPAEQRGPFLLVAINKTISATSVVQTLLNQLQAQGLTATELFLHEGYKGEIRLFRVGR